MRPFIFFRKRTIFDVEYPPNIINRVYSIRYAFHLGWMSYCEGLLERDCPLTEQRHRNIWMMGYGHAKNKVYGNENI